MSAAQIERLALGHSGLSLPRVALGCGNFGGIGSHPRFFGRGQSQDEALALMDRAWELGITHFDTADAYGGGRSEQYIGEWIASRGVLPTITTKTFNPMDEGADQGLEPERVVRQLDASLERLGVDHVELFLAHDFDPDVPLDRTFNAFERLMRDGRIRAYGVSNFSASQLEAALIAGDLAAVQNSHSLLDRGDEREVLPLCAEEGISYLAFGPLAGGWLTGKYRRGAQWPAGSRMEKRPEPYAELVSDETFDTIEALSAAAAKRGLSLAGLALSWILADRRVTQIVCGPGRPEHLEPVLEALANPLTTEERDQIARLK